MDTLFKYNTTHETHSMGNKRNNDFLFLRKIFQIVEVLKRADPAFWKGGREGGRTFNKTVIQWGAPSETCEQVWGAGGRSVHRKIFLGN